MKILRWRAGRGPIPPLLVIGAIIALALVLLVLAFMVIRGFDQSRELRAEVIRSYETRAELQHVLSLHSDIETSQRGFQLTGDAGFLQPYFGVSRPVCLREGSASPMTQAESNLQRVNLARTTVARGLATAKPVF